MDHNLHVLFAILLNFIFQFFSTLAFFFLQKANWQENATILRNTEKPLRGYTVIGRMFPYWLLLL